MCVANEREERKQVSLRETIETIGGGADRLEPFRSRRRKRKNKTSARHPQSSGFSSPARVRQFYRLCRGNHRTANPNVTRVTSRRVTSRRVSGKEIEKNREEHQEGRTRQPLHEQNRVGRSRRLRACGALRTRAAFPPVRLLRDLALLFPRLGLRLALLPHRGVPRGRVVRASALAGGRIWRARTTRRTWFIVNGNSFIQPTGASPR